MAVSEPKFRIESKSENYEIRLYESTIVAETLVEADFDEAGNKAFRILADYIFGNNKSKVKIDMTAPVAQQSTSEKIAMTAPVSQMQDARGQLVQFTMPDSFTMETLPEPIDARVHLRKIDPRAVAVFSYSGSWSESRYKSKLAEFKSELLKNNVKTTGEPIFARFNSPFQIWFLRRNEIWLEVAR
ncbi:MAG: heme-binding protein [Bdellovibrionaceae bacterium]|nr:heme-binding protein [Pseudobdellovibrionaceae bacterium]